VKRYCESDEVRRDLDRLEIPNVFKATPVEGLRKIPRALRAQIRPGQVFETKPRPNADITSSLGKPLKVRVKYYVPNSGLDCPIDERIEVRGGRDYTLNELLVGLSLKEAVRRLKAEGCSQSDYEVDYRYRQRSGDPVVSRSRTVDDTGRDQVRLTVDHGAPELQLGFVGIEPGSGRVPLRLDDTGRTLSLIQSKRQGTDFVVHVATRAGGVGFRRLRVELRDPGEDLVAIAFTDGQGRARFSNADVTDDGTYEVWASHTDAEGDALVGWKQIQARNVKTDFTGYDGARYRAEGGRFTRAAAVSAVRGRAAQGSDALAEMRRQATRIFETGRAMNDSGRGVVQSGLPAAQIDQVNRTYGSLAFFGRGDYSLQDLAARGVRPSIATLGGSLPLGIGLAPSVGETALAIDGRTIVRQPATGIQVGQGALGFVTDAGVTLFADGTYVVQYAGGNGFRNGAALGSTVLDVTRSTVAIDQVGSASLVGLIGQDGAGLVSDNGLGVLSDNGLGLVSDPSASIVAGGAGNIVAGGAGNLTSNAGGTIVSAGAGNLIGQDGAGLIGQDGAG
jgi:hypothetical protein